MRCKEGMGRRNRVSQLVGAAVRLRTRFRNLPPKRRRTRKVAATRMRLRTTGIRLVDPVTVIVEELAAPAFIDENNQIDDDDESDARYNPDVQTVKLQ